MADTSFKHICKNSTSSKIYLLKPVPINLSQIFQIAKASLNEFSQMERKSRPKIYCT